MEDGLINLQDPVSQYIPSFANMEVLVPGESGDFKDFTTVSAQNQITIENLLNHTSGLDYNLNNNPYLAPLLLENNISDGYSTTPGTIEEMVDRLAEVPLLFEPGTQFSYGLNADVLGRVVEVASGQSLAQFLEERIFEPLGMSDTDFFVSPEQEERLATLYTYDDEGVLEAIGDITQEITPSVFVDANYPLETGDTYFSGGAGLTSTPEDFGTFLQMLLNNGELTNADNQQTISIANPETVEQFLSIRDNDPSLEGSGLGSFFHWEDYTFTNGFVVKNNPAISATPGSEGSFRWAGLYNTHYFADPAEDLIGVIMSQNYPYTLALSNTFEQGTYNALKSVPEPSILLGLLMFSILGFSQRKIN